jgi:predicted small metal-binding protein
MFVGKALRCDCGYEVRAYDEEALVEGIRRHARDAHRIDFSLEFALDVARGARLVSSEREWLELVLDGVNGREKQ